MGQDAYWKYIITNESMQVRVVVAQRSKLFGWVLSGACNGDTGSKVPVTSPQMLYISKVSDSDVSRVWDIETIRIQSKESHNVELNAAQQEFSQCVSFARGRYEVSLSWKSDSLKGALQNNDKPAMKRLAKLHAKLDEDDELKTAYYKIFEDYV